MGYKIKVKAQIRINDSIQTVYTQYVAFYFLTARRIYDDFISKYLDKYSHNEISSCTIQLIECSNGRFNILYQWKI